MVLSKLYTCLCRKFDTVVTPGLTEDTNVMAQKKAGAEYLLDISATRLSL
jgi:hypothetical protein